MNAPSLPRDGKAAIERLAALADLDSMAINALATASMRWRSVSPRSELSHEGSPISERLLILRGWGARLRVLKDGRRQIMSFLLPGDLIGNCHQKSPLAVSTVMTLTEVELCPAPAPDDIPSLAEAYAVSAAMEEAFLLAQVTRLGRLNAEERMLDLLLELLERMRICGRANHDRFAFPLTQEVLADMTGLTAVHVNRTLQLLRQQGDIILGAGELQIVEPEQIAERIGRVPVIVSETMRIGG